MGKGFNVKRSEIEEKTPFTTQLMGRSIPQLPIYDPTFDKERLPEHMEDEEWFLIVPGREQTLQFLKGEAYEAVYWGITKADEARDIHIPFLQVYHQHLSWADILGVLPGLVQDVRHLTASLTKLAIFQRITNSGQITSRRLVALELENLFAVSRSMYDILQFVAANTWKKVHLEDGEKSPLPKRFSDMALKGESPREAEELVRSYGIPEELATYYEDEASRFANVRKFRDDILHRGKSIKLIYRTSDGLAIQADQPPFTDFRSCHPDLIDQNGVAPLWPYVADLVDHTVSSMDRFVDGLFARGLGVPPEMAPGYTVYARGEHIHNLNFLGSLKSDDPWGSNFCSVIEERLDWD